MVLWLCLRQGARRAWGEASGERGSDRCGGEPGRAVLARRRAMACRPGRSAGRPLDAVDAGGVRPWLRGLFRPVARTAGVGGLGASALGDGPARGVAPQRFQAGDPGAGAVGLRCRRVRRRQAPDRGGEGARGPDRRAAAMGRGLGARRGPAGRGWPAAAPGAGVGRRLARTADPDPPAGHPATGHAAARARPGGASAGHSQPAAAAGQPRRLRLRPRRLLRERGRGRPRAGRAVADRSSPGALAAALGDGRQRGSLGAHEADRRRPGSGDRWPGGGHDHGPRGLHPT